MLGETRTSKLLSKLRGPARDASGSGDLVDRFFMMQDERPAAIAEVEIDRLDPFLRNLLFTDGTVTRSLAVQTLEAVSVRRISQLEVSVPAHLADCLEAEPGDFSIRRRVVIALGSAAVPLLWAESYVLADRLPPGFVAMLDTAPDGIGQSLQQVALESRRELLWFGLDAAPGWADAAGAARGITIRRLYRVVSDGQVSILISESFAVEESGDGYRLARADAGMSGKPPAAGGEAG
jgi:chorismate-pyruvate lyase